EYRGRNRYHPEHRRYRRQHDRTETGHGGFDHRVPYRLAFRPLGLDLVDENDRVARDHAEQRQDAQNRHEAERLVEDQERGHDADEAHRDDAEHQEKTAEALKLDHQESDDDEQHQRNDGINGGLRSRAFLDRATHRDMVGPRQACGEFR